jgi:hypothetical protein
MAKCDRCEEVLVGKNPFRNGCKDCEIYFCTECLCDVVQGKMQYTCASCDEMIINKKDHRKLYEYVEDCLGAKKSVTIKNPTTGRFEQHWE